MKSQSTKIAVFTTLITCISTILVAFIGIFPQLREGDVNKIEALEKRLNNLAALYPATEPAQAAWKIQGTLTNNNIEKKSLDAEIYLMPSSWSHFTTTDDNGAFSFTDVPPHTYYILIRKRDTDTKESRRLLVIGPGEQAAAIDTHLTVNGAFVEYTITPD